MKSEDKHAATAAEIFGVPIGEVTAKQRRYAKTVDFGPAYGPASLHPMKQPQPKEAK